MLFRARSTAWGVNEQWQVEIAVSSKTFESRRVRALGILAWSRGQGPGRNQPTVQNADLL